MDPTKIEISARITSQSVPEELRFDILGADIEKGKLPLFLKFPHNTTLKMTTKEAGSLDEKIEIQFTMEEDIELMFEALTREVAETSRRATKVPHHRKSYFSESRNLYYYRRRTRKDTTIACTELADLVIFDMEPKATLEKKQAEKCNNRTKLTKAGQVGLLRKLDWSDCPNHNQITSVDNVVLKKNISLLNIDSFFEFHKSYLTEVHPGGSIRDLNYDPIPMWKAGVQAVTLNLPVLGTQDREIHGLPIQVNNAMFRDTNGGCGYVLKPEGLATSPETSCIITLKILEGRHLKAVTTLREQLFSPHIEVTTTQLYI